MFWIIFPFFFSKIMISYSSFPVAAAEASVAFGGLFRRWLLARGQEKYRCKRQ